MKIAIVNGNNGMPVNGETTLSYHVAKMLQAKGHTPEIISVSASGKPKKADMQLPIDVKIVHEKYKTIDKIQGQYDRVLLNSVPYGGGDGAMLLLEKLPEFDLVMHGHTNIKTMCYHLFSSRARKIITMDKVILETFPDAVFSVCPFFLEREQGWEYGRWDNKIIVSMTRLSFVKNPAEVKAFIQKHPEYKFLLYGTSSSDSGMVFHKFFKGIPNVEAKDALGWHERNLAYTEAKFALDLSKHTIGKGTLHYARLEPMYFGVVPIFIGEYVDVPFYGINISAHDYSLEIPRDVYDEIAKKNLAELKTYSNPEIIRAILG